MRNLHVHDLGRASYDDALARQDGLLRRVQANPGEAHLLLVEHDPPVITLGRRGRREHVLATDAELAAAGVQVRRCVRGGEVTWHGPGQLVAYPIVSLRGPARGLRRHVHALEQAVLDALARLGVEGASRTGQRGVWVGGAKIAAVGVAASRWVAWHGLAVNVGTDLGGFARIVPCGQPGAAVTSVSRELGREVGVEEVKPVLVGCLREALGAGAGLSGSGSAGGGTRSGAGCLSRRRLPEWLRRPLPGAGRSDGIRSTLKRLGLNTVCHGAHCPNRAECFARGTATFMILGSRCTRNCRFCAVEDPPPEPVRADEPEAVAEAAAEAGLRHVVVTSVTRDDLPDGGAGQFVRTLRAVRRRRPEATIEVLTPDFLGHPESVRAVVAAGPDVFNHNVETVPRLYPSVRPQADYARSLHVLHIARRAADASGRALLTKSGLMVGLGETRDELRRVLADLRARGCDVLTVGQYLAPSPAHVPVARFLPPEEFAEIEAEARGLGFAAVAAGPFVRSSYRADGALAEAASR